MAKKLTSVIITIALVFCFVSVYAAATDIDSVNGLIPLRQAAESVGYEVIWNGEDCSVQLIKGDDNVKIKIGSNLAESKGKIMGLSSSPVLIDNKTYVPADLLCTLTQMYVSKNSDSGYIISECAAPDGESMLDVISALSAQPRGVQDESHEVVKRYLTDKIAAIGYEAELQEFNTDPYAGIDREKGVNIIFAKKPDLPATGDVLIFGAHYDGAKGFPAANDNGSGVSVLLETAQILKDLPSDTEIRFVLFDAEELGLIGSKHYINTLSDHKNVIGMINFDMLGAAKSESLSIHTGDNKRNYLFDIFTQIPQYQDSSLKAHPFGMSDHMSFMPKLIPVLDISHEAVQDEYHNENDIIDNIDVNKLTLSADYGIAIAKIIMSDTTPSYMSIAKPEQKINTANITEDMHVNTGDLKEAVSRSIGAELVQVESDDDQIAYMVYVNLFGMEKKAKLIYKNQPGSPHILNPIIEFTDTDITFDEIKAKLDEVFGAAEKKNITGGYWYQYKNIYGNFYNLYNIESEQRFYLQVTHYLDNEDEAYSISEGKLIRMSNDRLEDIYRVSNTNGSISVTTEPCLPDETLEISPQAKQCFEKIHPYIKSGLIDDISYIVVRTDGIGTGIPVYVLDNDSSVTIYDFPDDDKANPVPEEYKNLPKSVISRIKGIPDGREDDVSCNIKGNVLYIDYNDFLKEDGLCYSNENLTKEIAYSYCNDYMIKDCIRYSNKYPQDGSLFEKAMYVYDKESFVYKFADEFYHDVFNLDNYYDYDLFGLYPRNYVSEAAAVSLITDISCSFAEFVISDKPVSDHISDKKVMFFYDYPEFTEKRSELRKICGIE